MVDKKVRNIRHSWKTKTQEKSLKIFIFQCIQIIEKVNAKREVDFWSNRKPLSKPQPLKNKGKTATGRKPNVTQITIN